MRLADAKRSATPVLEGAGEVFGPGFFDSVRRKLVRTPADGINGSNLAESSKKLSSNCHAIGAQVRTSYASKAEKFYSTEEFDPGSE